MTINSWGSENPLEETKGGSSQNSYTTGDILYASASNTLSKLAIGSSDDVLTLASGLPSWAAQSGGSGDWIYVSQQTASSDATIEFTDIGSASKYLMLITGLAPSTNSQNFYMRTSSNGGSSYDSGASDYAWSEFYLYSSGSGYSGDQSDSKTQIGRASQSSTQINNIALTIFDPSSATQTSTTFQSSRIDNSGNIHSEWGSNWRLSSADVDALQFYYSSDNIATGIFTLYKQVT